MEHKYSILCCIIISFLSSSYSTIYANDTLPAELLYKIISLQPTLQDQCELVTRLRCTSQSLKRQMADISRMQQAINLRDGNIEVTLINEHYQKSPNMRKVHFLVSCHSNPSPYVFKLFTWGVAWQHLSTKFGLMQHGKTLYWLLDTAGLASQRPMDEDYQRIQCAINLIRAGDKVNYAEPPCNTTPLHLAIANGRNDLVKILLQHGANIHTPSTRYIQYYAVDVHNTIFHYDADMTYKRTRLPYATPFELMVKIIIPHYFEPEQYRTYHIEEQREEKYSVLNYAQKLLLILVHWGTETADTVNKQMPSPNQLSMLDFSYLSQLSKEKKRAFLDAEKPQPQTCTLL